MKTQKNIFDKVISIENLKEAHKKASRGKSNYKDVKMVNSNVAVVLSSLHNKLYNEEFTTSQYIVSTEMKGTKLRTIHKLPYFPDRIVQHAIVNICAPVWKKSFIRDTFQSISGRGTTDCFRRVKQAIQTEHPTFALKLDIKKFYPSVKNIHLLNHKIFRINDKRVWNLIKNIIESLPELPLGNHISQYAGNLLLSPIDWYAKQNLKIKHYYRYCDDIVIMDNSKNKLLEWANTINSKLKKIDLELHEERKIINLSNEHLDFVGYRINHNKVLLRKSIAKNFIQACKHHNIKSMPSYYGWAKHCNSKNLWYKNTRGMSLWKHKAIAS